MTAVPPPLWPRYARSEDLAGVERVPLHDRGLPASTGELLRRAADQWPDRLAVSVLPSAARWREPLVWTFRDLDERVRGLVDALTGLGVGRRDAVAIVCPNTADVLATTLAAQVVGIAAPVNPMLGPDHLENLLRLSGAQVVVTAGPDLDPTVWERVCTVARRLQLRSVLALGSGTGSPESVPLAPVDGPTVAVLDDGASSELGAARSCQPAGDGAAARPEDLASYVHTGGTTGAPRLAAHTHANQVTMAWTVAARLPRDQVVWAALPLFHVNALTTVLAGLFTGQHVVWGGPLGYRDPDLYPAFWRIVEHYRIGVMSAVPTVYAALSQVPVDADISSLRLPVVGASPLPDAVRRRFRRHTGLDLCEGYGLTEATCVSALSFPGVPRPGTVGQRLAYQSVAAVRPSHDGWIELPPGESGRLVIGGPTVFAGYLRDGPEGPVPDPTGAVVDGWVDTGDLGSVDTEGFVRLAGRAKDVVIRGGHNIDPLAVEEVLLQHPGVEAAGVVGRPDRHAGEVPVAYVVAPDVAPREIVDHVAAHAPEPAAVPVQVHVVPHLPTTPVGKPDKVALRADVLSRLVREVAGDAGMAAVEVSVVVDQDGHPVAEVTPPPEVPSDAARRTLTTALDGYSIRWHCIGRGAADSADRPDDGDDPAPRSEESRR
ncbi:MAG: acyl-CoA synthetase [Dermatophilaceae bacterium]